MAFNPDPPALPAFLIRGATADRMVHYTGGRHSGSRLEPGVPATIMVGGVEWTSRVPRTQSECDQTNAWAAKIIQQNTPKTDA
jgi:hypothetical protein